MRIIQARFKSRCAETGRIINKGDTCLYAYGKVFHTQSTIYKNRLAEMDQSAAARDNAGDYCDAVCNYNYSR